jgi:hypothetical protein
MVAPVHPRRPKLRTLVPLALCASLGCDDLSEFRGDFSGSIVEGGFVRECFGPNVRATLQFDPDLTEQPSASDVTQQNRLTTSDGTFLDTPLVPLSALPHDPLSKLDFPGSRRLRSYLLFARPVAGPLSGRDATVVVSLMADERVELRIMARSGETTSACRAASGEDAGVSDAGLPDGGVATQGQGPHVNEYFGLFLLKGT